MKPAEFSSNVRELLRKIAVRDNIKNYAEAAADIIRKRTRLGFGVSKPGAEKKPLAALATSTIDARKGAVSFHKSPSSGKSFTYPRSKSHGPVNLSDKTSPSKSNLTRTGQLLDSITVKSISGNSATIGPDGERDDGKSNKDVGTWATDGDSKKARPPRPFNNLSAAEQKQVENMIRRDMENLIRSNLTKGK